MADLESAQEKHERRGKLLGFVLSLCFINLSWTGIYHVGLGDREIAVIGFGVLPIVLALGWLLIRGGMTAWVTPSTVAVFYTAIAATMFAIGAQWSLGHFAAMLIPVLAISLVGRRLSWDWTLIALVTLATVLMLASVGKLDGISFLAAVAEEQAHGAICRAVSILTLTVAAVTLLYESFHRITDQAVRDSFDQYEVGERRFQAIVENANDFIAEMDQQGRFTWVSPGFAERMCTSEERLLGHAAHEFGRWDDFEKVKAHWKVLMEKGSVKQGSIRFRDARGRSRWFEISMRCYEAAAGEVRVVAVARDTSDRVDRENLLRHQENQVIVGTMAAGAAHQLNDPISSILAASQYAIALREKAHFSGAASDSLEIIEEEARRCGKILRSMLAFAREEGGERWSEDLHQVIHRAVRSIESDEGPLSAEIVLSFCSEVPRVMMSPLEFEQTMIHLIRNAIEAKASVIVIGTDMTERRTVEITISDDGTGLNAEAEVSAFDAFFTTSPSTRSGLGLNIARRIIKEHFGSLALVETSEEGSIFQICLPQLRLLEGGTSISLGEDGSGE